MSILDYAEKARQRAWGFLVKKYGPYPILGLAAAGLLLAVTLFFENWASAQWLTLKSGWRALMDAPIGLAGLIFFVVLVALIVVAFVDTSPTVEAIKAWRRSRGMVASVDVPPPVVLSADEKDAIAKIRHLWQHDGGAMATRFLVALWGTAIDGLGQTRYYGNLFNFAADPLSDAAMALQNALAIDKKVPLEEVIAAFNRLFGEYLKSAEILYRMHQHGDLSWFKPPCLEPFQKFRRYHKKFGEHVVQATSFPGINGRLLIFAPQGMPLDSRKFLGEQPWDGEQPPPLDGPSA